MGDTIHLSGAVSVDETLFITDMSAIIGGEELAMILPETDLAGGTLIAEELRERIEASAFVFEDEDIGVTVSFGVAQLDPSWSSYDFVKATDDQLYQAKRTGRAPWCRYPLPVAVRRLPAIPTTRQACSRRAPTVRASSIERITSCRSHNSIFRPRAPPKSPGLFFGVPTGPRPLRGPFPCAAAPFPVL